MIVPVIADELNAATNFDEFLNTMRYTNGIEIKESKLSGQRAALLTRPEKFNPNNAVHDECGIAVVTDDYTLVAKTVDKVYKLGDTFCKFRIPTESTCYVEEKLPGVGIVVAKYELTYVLATKKSMHGTDDIFGRKAHTAASFFMERINKIFPNNGIDGLFDQAWVSPIAWTFQITPDKQGEPKLVLVAAINMSSGHEMTLSQLDNVAEHYGIERPKKITIQGREELDDAVAKLLSENPKLTQVILRGQREDKAYYDISETHKRNTILPGSHKDILMLTAAVMNGIQVLDFNANELLKVLEDNTHRLQAEAEVLYNLHKARRTRRRFAENILHHPMSPVLFAMRDSKIDTTKELYKVLKPSVFLKILKKVDGERMETAIANYKEIACQQET